MYGVSCRYDIRNGSSRIDRVILLWNLGNRSVYTEACFSAHGVSLAGGILDLLLAVTLLTEPSEDMLAFFGYLLGFELITIGFEQITSASRLRAIGVNGTGWLTADGILNLIFGIILLFAPMASLFAISMVLALYLIFKGISLLVISFNAKDLEA